MTCYATTSILITGVNGQLGHEFQKLFSKLGINCTATDYAELDITNEEALHKFFKNKQFHYIINCAAYNDVDKAEDDRDNCFALNALAPAYLAKIAKDIQSVFVTYSTDFVFDGRKKEPYTEKDTPNPLSVYAQSKLEGEK